VKHVQFVGSEQGKKTAVVIDLSWRSELGENVYDRAASHHLAERNLRALKLAGNHNGESF